MLEFGRGRFDPRGPLNINFSYDSIDKERPKWEESVDQGGWENMGRVCRPGWVGKKW